MSEQELAVLRRVPKCNGRLHLGAIKIAESERDLESTKAILERLVESKHVTEEAGFYKRTRKGEGEAQ